MDRIADNLEGHAAIDEIRAAPRVAVELHFLAAEGFGVDEFSMGDVEQIVVDEPVVRFQGFEAAVALRPRGIFPDREAGRNRRFIACPRGIAEPGGEGFAGEAFNFGTETPLSVVDMASRILGVMDRGSLELTIMNQASNEIPRQYLDCTKARSRMEWHPKWSMDDSLRETVAWYSDWFSRNGGARDERPAATGSAS